jgi:hypothetical protein
MEGIGQSACEGSGNGSLRIGVSTYEMNATEIHGDERLVMMKNGPQRRKGLSIKLSMKAECLSENGRFSFGRHDPRVTHQAFQKHAF